MSDLQTLLTAFYVNQPGAGHLLSALNKFID